MVAEVRPHEVLTKLVGVGSPLRALLHRVFFSPLFTVISPTLGDNRLHTYYLLYYLSCRSLLLTLHLLFPSLTTYTFALLLKATTRRSYFQAQVITP
ncbi:hypothetical protein BO85DRAFT_29563 [Aspergillus piperis CBS 112811]|uniref:Uncharacterized protein n=1 Tax=Aspergillus piperis CBS 112811 TaxID=1448313 RepID=A0A8G1R0L7_9EURO|nr:hypothetical protein BO85DRAFT_29563 [Aspergillus piperis CBS 112811]RAH56972.1 hypothetical protein BO85DRAFT_29563 [Aspergillus piperis CBS 112811]